MQRVLGGCLLPLLLGLAVLSAPMHRVWAETPQDRARRMFREGNEHFKERDYHRALSLYRSAYALFPSHRINFNIGTTLEMMGYQTQAAEHFEAFLSHVEPGRERAVVELARKKLERLRSQLGRLHLRCPQPGVTVTADHWKLGVTPMDRTLYLTPGAYTLSLHRDGFTTLRLSLRLKAGGEETVAVPGLTPAGPSDPRGPRGALSEGPGTGRSPKARRASIPLLPEEGSTVDAGSGASRPVYKTWWFWTLVGAGAAALATGLAVGLTQEQGDPVQDFNPDYGWGR